MLSIPTIKYFSESDRKFKSLNQSTYFDEAVEFDFARRYRWTVRWQPLFRNTEYVLHIHQASLSEMVSALRTHLYILLTLRLLRYRHDLQIFLDVLLAQDVIRSSPVGTKIPLTDPLPCRGHHTGGTQILRAEVGENFRH